MNKFNLLWTMLLPCFCFSQNAAWQQVDWKDYVDNDKGTVVFQEEDFYVVDSIYCYLYDPFLQEDIPTSRQYNISFIDDVGEILESYSQQFDPMAGTWQNSAFTTNVYDDEVDLVEVKTEVWDVVNSGWMNAERTQNVPNEFGNYTQVLNQKWHVQTADWRNVFQQKITYNDNGHIQLLGNCRGGECNGAERQ